MAGFRDSDGVQVRRFSGTAGVALTLVAGLLGTGAALAAVPEIVVLSNIRADLVSGGDALVEVRLPTGADSKAVTVKLNGRDVTDQFAVRADGRYEGLLKGLVNGQNSVVAQVNGGRGAKLTVTNYPLQGPILHPQLQPWICETQLVGLAPSTPPNCEAPTKYEFLYKRAGGNMLNDQFVPYDLASPPPASEVAMTTTDQGKTVPFVVRRERGVINRGIYEITVLAQPGQDSFLWNPQSAWNGKVLMHFQGGTKIGHLQTMHGISRGAGPFGQTLAGQGKTPAPSEARISITAGDAPLALGFAVTTSTISQVNNAVTGAETAMMLKEHLIETYGPVRYTLAVGISGGSMMQHLTAQNYPGLLDGLIPMSPLPDMWSAIMNDASADYGLLLHYFNDLEPKLWADNNARIAVYGGTDANKYPVATAYKEPFYWYHPEYQCTASYAKDEQPWVYDPVRNPGGTRCALQEYYEQIFGTREKSLWGPIEKKIGRGFVNRPIDNVGVQYGLDSLKRGQITPEQFVDLNQKIGGIDLDGNYVGQRHEAERAGLRNLYRSGQLTNGRGLDNVPMIHMVSNEPIDVYHPLIATEELRARMIKANGNADNMIHYVTVDDYHEQIHLQTQKSEAMRRAAFLMLDKWVAAIEADHGAAPLAAKVRRDKPADAKDTCWANSQPGAKCHDMFLFPRMVAGGPVAGDIQKCQLKPINWSEYGSVSFTADQKQRLKEAFPKGVCDWSKPGVEQQPQAGVWQTYMDTVGGRPLGPAPRSQALAGSTK